MTNDEKQNQGSVKPFDKLTYKILIQLRIAKCLDAIERDDGSSNKSTWALRCTIFFNQGKIRFKDEILEKEAQLDKRYEDWLSFYSRESNRYYWGNPMYFKEAETKKLKELWNEEFLFLIDMLGKYKALMDQLDYIEEWKELKTDIDLEDHLK